MKWAILIGLVALVGVLLVWSLQRDNSVDVEPPAATLPAHQGSAATATLEREPGVFAEEEYAQHEQDCAPKMNPEQIRLATQRLERELELADQVLLDTNNSEYQLAAVLLNRWDDPPLAMNLLQELTAERLNDPVLVWAALIICGQRPALNCDLGALEETAIDADGDNGAMWVQVAALRLSTDDEEGAIDALRRAISAPIFDNYYDEQILLVERGLAVGSNLSYSERVFLALGTASVTPIALNSLTARCKSGVAGVWPELCDQLGFRMTTDGDNLLTKMLGVDLRKIALTNQGDEKGLADLARERDALSQSLGSIEENQQILNLMMNDELVLRNYLENLEVYGEGEARRRIFAEMQRLKNSPEYDQCNFAGFGIDF